MTRQSVDRAVLYAAPELLDALALRPSLPPRCSNIGMMRAYESAMRFWESSILAPALQRTEAGIHDPFPREIALLGAAEWRTGEELPAHGRLRRRVPGGGTQRGRTPAPDLARNADDLRNCLPFYLTNSEVCHLGRVTRDTVNRAVFLTRQGLAEPGSPQYLPRAKRIAAGFERSAVAAWLEARGQLPRRKRVG